MGIANRSASDCTGRRASWSPRFTIGCRFVDAGGSSRWAWDDAQIAEARRFLATAPWATGRYDVVKGDATRLDFEPESFDCAFLCWILEHVSDPARVLGEVRRVLSPGAPIVCAVKC